MDHFNGARSIELAREKKRWKLDNTSDLARVLRYPGTWNRKSNIVTPVLLVSADENLRYSAAELEEWATNASPHVAALDAAIVTNKLNTVDYNDRRKAADFDDIKTNCPVVADWVVRMTNGVRLPEPEWHHFLSIAGACDDGASIARDLSSLDDRFDKAEFATYMARRAPPHKCETIQQTCGTERCADCPLMDQGRSPITFGFGLPSDIERADAIQRFVRVSTPNVRYFDLDHLNRNMELLPDALDSEIGYLFDGKAHAALMASPEAQRVRLAQYLPGNHDRITKTSDSIPVLNLWTPSPLQPAQGEWPVFRRHLDLLYSDPDDGAVAREHLLDCLSFIVKHPGEKIRHAYLLTSAEQQIGKGQLLELVKLLLGPDNHQTIEGEDFGEKFNAHTADYQLLVVEELPLSNKLGVYNKIKTLLSERDKLVEKKGVQKFRARTPDFLLATSNHSRPITLEKADKRVFFYESPMRRQAGDYYGRLAEAIKSEASAILHDLLHRDLSNFDPKAPPPMTAAKRRLLYDSMPEAEKSLHELVGDGNAPFDRDVIHMDQLRFALGVSSTRNQRFDALKAIGAIQTGQMRAEPGNRKSPKRRLWIIRNFDRWKNATEAQITAQWKGI
ncbi:primase-helicase family protein [Rhizobium mesoamericanum]|uniref:primase-helicase family protein n=1 Tax=Rhizobium mesoamericanum TaxID=1079800 RepID=UPI00040EAB3C|nr:primase-helicase family protein [Rhizobium mesoamericanum]